MQGDALPLAHLSHLSRVVADPEKSAAFYRNVLGFRDIRRPSSFDFDGRWLAGHGVTLHLIKGRPLRASLDLTDIRPADDHTSFQSNSLPAVKEALRRHGIRFVETQVEERGVRVTQIFFHDPDHNMIEVCDCDCLPIEPLYAQDAHAQHVLESCAQQNAAALTLASQASMDSSSSRCAGMSPLRHALRSEAA